MTKEELAEIVADCDQRLDAGPRPRGLEESATDYFVRLAHFETYTTAFRDYAARMRDWLS